MNKKGTLLKSQKDQWVNSSSGH